MYCHITSCASQVKNRMDPCYDAFNTAGYRDICLNLLLHTPVTCALGLDTHVCEVQLILRPIYELKVDSMCLVFLLKQLLHFCKPVSFPAVSLQRFWCRCMLPQLKADYVLNFVCRVIMGTSAMSTFAICVGNEGSQTFLVVCFNLIASVPCALLHYVSV